MQYSKDIYTENPADPDTLANLGPLAPLAGTWYGDQGVDTHPVAEGTESEPFVETLTFELLDPQNSGPQQLYGLRYHVAVTKPGELTAFHDQVGYRQDLHDACHSARPSSDGRRDRQARRQADPSARRTRFHGERYLFESVPGKEFPDDIVGRDLHLQR